ncbi:MAG: CoA transferase [Actinobacteria bacterium]|nr:CoA transferase [Actinomycetota bacterium]
MASLFAQPCTVVELGDSISASACGMYLRHLGAEVVKVEPPGGSPIRQQPPFAGADGPSALYSYLNHGKRVVTADINTPDGRNSIEELLRGPCDVVVMSGTLGEWEAVGLEPARVRDLASKAIIGRISRFGDDGPHQDLLGAELQFQALGGLLYLVGDGGREPVRLGGAQMQYSAGAGMFSGVMLGLYRRERSGEGSTFATSVFEMVPYLEWKNALEYQLSGKVTSRSDEGRPMIFRCADGFSAFMVPPRDWDRMSKLVGDERLEDPRFATPELRQQNAVELHEAIAEVLAPLSKRDIYHRAQAQGITLGYVATMSDLLESEQYLARGWLEQVDLEGGGKGTIAGAPFTVITPERQSEGRRQ